VIGQRKQDINAIADIMNDINTIAQDLAIETKEQGEKLEKLDDNVRDADKKAEEALSELKNARKY